MISREFTVKVRQSLDLKFCIEENFLKISL